MLLNGDYNMHTGIRLNFILIQLDCIKVIPNILQFHKLNQLLRLDVQ